MNIINFFGQVFCGISSYYGQGNKRLRKLRRIEKKAWRGLRQFAGYTLDSSERLTSSQLTSVFLPDCQTAEEAYIKLVRLNKDEKYSILLLWCWAAELGKSCQFISLPHIA